MGVYICFGLSPRRRAKRRRRSPGRGTPRSCVGRKVNDNIRRDWFDESLSAAVGAREAKRRKWKDACMAENFRHRRPDVTEVERVGGPEKRRLHLVSHDDRWAALYVEHERRIRGALADVPIDIEHIGSTSVPGLAAKPIIDILVTVHDITAEEDYLDALVASGYGLRVREPGHRMMRTPARDVHVHLLEQADPAVDEYLLFRDHLRADADDRTLYEVTKRELLTRDWDDMNAYADAKTEVISAIKARARHGRR
jgi:GrpB-like predicted nucleotidyltransferase (UPF0157 family)